MFQAGYGRYATYGVIAVLPGEIIDSIWHIIDRNLQGVVPLQNMLNFNLGEKEGKLTITFTEADNAAIKITFDLPYSWNEEFPKEVLAYDDGRSQTILLPSEAS
ncbi:hypothetical protein FC83_GL002278 [Agrilactobacillus composti DSM 18527 = JCM 14202]|uniref:Uncharacterized protein n=1 Tax=Agrilactobacillus composti DSM 18527 = JCM 14202 TaxID=1423734 RepID=X0QRY9_9LACO|nr:DUF960 domain-containing protein [Agrilactobacillus composti]KRM36873.1 hypothetical protein FC83_GL002278 [Agrilactobacillus composti DSM 18527 = JCM 14202]GAF41395.1 hypothetical protein JCM14202_3330 [Agrilactobacillus composti DSM 18527 = JCM 14202]